MKAYIFFTLQLMATAFELKDFCDMKELLVSYYDYFVLFYGNYLLLQLTALLTPCRIVICLKFCYIEFFYILQNVTCKLF